MGKVLVFMGGVIAGAILGGAAALLMTPQSGEHTGHPDTWSKESQERSTPELQRSVEQTVRVCDQPSGHAVNSSCVR